MQNSGWPCCCQIAMSAVFVCGASLENNRVFYPIARVVFLYFYSSWWCCCCCCCWWWCSCFPHFLFFVQTWDGIEKCEGTSWTKIVKTTKKSIPCFVVDTTKYEHGILCWDTIAFKGQVDLRLTLDYLPKLAFGKHEGSCMAGFQLNNFSPKNHLPNDTAKHRRCVLNRCPTTAAKWWLFYFWTYRVQLTIPK